MSISSCRLTDFAAFTGSPKTLGTRLGFSTEKEKCLSQPALILDVCKPTTRLTAKRENVLTAISQLTWYAMILSDATQT
jgi:hypothetical protein